jgi:hypothetical protein
MGLQNCRIVGKSQPVLMMINPMIVNAAPPARVSQPSDALSACTPRQLRSESAALAAAMAPRSRPYLRRSVIITHASSQKGREISAKPGFRSGYF